MFSCPIHNRRAEAIELSVFTTSHALLLIDNRIKIDPYLPSRE